MRVSAQSLKKRVREINLVDTEMKELKVTVFGNIPKMDRLGLRKGSVLEVSGIILHSGSRYICVNYDRLGSMIRVLPKDNELSKHVLSTIGKKRKSKSNISQPTETQTIKYLKDNRLSGLFKIQKMHYQPIFTEYIPRMQKMQDKKDRKQMR